VDVGVSVAVLAGVGVGGFNGWFRYGHRWRSGFSGKDYGLCRCFGKQFGDARRNNILGGLTLTREIAPGKHC